MEIFSMNFSSIFILDFIIRITCQQEKKSMRLAYPHFNSKEKKITFNTIKSIKYLPMQRIFHHLNTK